MVTSENDELAQDGIVPDGLTVETVDFPFDMSPPEFGADVADIDGTVLYLNSFDTANNDTVILKAADDGLIHLVAETSPLETGIIDAGSIFASNDLIGYHYYVFTDDLKIISEQALVILG